MGLAPRFDRNKRPALSTMPLFNSGGNQLSELDDCSTCPNLPINDVGDDYSTDLSANNQEALNIEQLLMNHLRFAHAFRKNDAAMIMQYLAKDVTLISVDGARHEGQSAVLAYLVGTRMSKISSNLRVKGCPTRSSACQSTFIYEHGIVFKDPLYMEILNWLPNSATIIRIAHVALPGTKSGKTTQEFGKSLPRRLSLVAKTSDDEELSGHCGDSDDRETRESESNNVNPSPKVRCRRLKSMSSSESSSAVATAANGRLSSSSSSTSSQSGVNEAAVQPLITAPVHSSAGYKNSTIRLIEISCTGLTPIRKRRTVNPYVVLRSSETGATWKSPVLRRQPDPKWNDISLLIPTYKLDDVVEVSLWDHSFFRSVKVAGAALVASDILKHDAEFSVNIQMEVIEGSRSSNGPQYVTMHLRFVRSYGNDTAFRSSDEVERISAQRGNCEVDKMGQSMAASSTLGLSFKWLTAYPFMESHHASVLLMLVRAVIVTAIVWMLFHATLVWPKQA